MITVCIPLKTVNPLNQRGHWRTVSKRGKREKYVTGMVLSAVRPVPRLPVTVTLTRLSPGKGFDAHDALPASCKHIVDGIAAWLGVDDADPRVTWCYEQRRAGPKFFGVTVAIEERTDPLPAAALTRARAHTEQDPDQARTT